MRPTVASRSRDYRDLLTVTFGAHEQGGFERLRLLFLGHLDFDLNLFFDFNLADLGM